MNQVNLLWALLDHQEKMENQVYQDLREIQEREENLVSEVPQDLLGWLLRDQGMEKALLESQVFLAPQGRRETEENQDPRVLKESLELLMVTSVI